MENVTETRQIPLMRIIPSRWQPRDAAFDAEQLWGLASSIKENGLINPVVVFEVKLSEDDPEPWFELVAGERRTRAVAGLAWGRLNKSVSAKDAIWRLAQDGLAAIPDEARALLEANGAAIQAQVESSEDMQRLHRMAVVENIERVALSPIEEARALRGLQDEYGWSQRELARKIGKSQSWVAARLSLLGLSEEAQAAVSTRVLNTTHGRAIAAVPEPLQPAVTAWAMAEVNRADTPATTRQVQNRARQLAAFVDPARWKLSPDRVYLPISRNRLAMIDWLLERADLEQRGKALLDLGNSGASNVNWLMKQPVELVEWNYGISEVVAALGYSSITNAWREFATDTDLLCDSCVFNEIAGTVPYCRSRDGRIATCQGWIGDLDPQLIPLDSDLTGWCRTLEIAYESEPFSHVTSVEDYVTAIDRVREAQQKQQEQNEQRRSTQHINAIQLFMEWQATQPEEWLMHFQAHACPRCTNYRDGLDVPCRFAVEPLMDMNGQQSYAPNFGILISEDGWMLPRCKQFAYREIPAIFADKKTKFGNRDQVLEWLHALALGGYNHHSVVWGVLRWLDYGRPLDQAADYAKLKRWISRNWEPLGGDGAIATLLDVAMSESGTRNAYQSPFALLNPVTGQVEQFASKSIGVTNDNVIVLGAEWGYPAGWPRPWESSSPSDDNST